MFGKKGGMFGNLKEAAKDAAEEAAGKDLDGDGRIGKRPVAQPVAAPHAAAPATAARGEGPAGGGVAAAAPQLLQQLSKTLKFNATPGSFLEGLGQFKKLSPEVQSRATEATSKLDDGSHMELSRLTGRRKSLLIGINYTGSQAQLKGCIADVKNIRAFIVDRLQFPTDAASMRILTDDGQNYATPTRANILEGFKWLIEGATSGDSLFLHYSGHGATQKDVSPDTDEADGQDETLVPLDYQTAGMIVDDEIFDILVRPLPKGVRLTCIMDCCHSGSVMDLPYSYVLESGRDLPVEIDNRKMAIAAAMAAGKAFMAGDKAGAMKSLIEAGKAGFAAYMQQQQQGGGGGAAAEQQQQPQAQAAPAEPVFSAPAQSQPVAQPAASGSNLSTSANVSANAIQIRTTVCDCIQFSGCKDDQTSADAFIGGESTGAMSYAFVKAFTDNGLSQTYGELLRNIRTILQGKYKQIPQMSVGHRMVDMNQPFKM